METESPSSGKSGFANSSKAINSSSSSNSNAISSSSRRNLLAELRSSSELPPRLATCPSIVSATTSSSQLEQCKLSQQLLFQRQKSSFKTTTTATLSTDTLPSGSSSSASTATAVTTTAATATSSSASSLASSSSIIKLTSIKSIYNVYFNSSWTMRLRCLDEFVAWTKFLLQLAGL